MRASGYSGLDLFSIKVARAIEKYSYGLIRRINILADKALLAAYVKNTRSPVLRDVVQAANDSRFSPKRFWMPWSRVMGIALLLTNILFFQFHKDAIHV